MLVIGVNAESTEKPLQPASFSSRTMNSTGQA